MLFTSDECHAIAEQKLSEAQQDSQQGQRLITAANRWILLARRLAEGERPASSTEEAR
jgi:hypothetical protein